MNSLPTNTRRDSESIRLFESDFLEFFTHISPVTVLVMWVPVTILLLADAVAKAPATGFPWYIPAAVILGWMLWTLTEYTLHRFLFHYKPRTPRLERLFFLFHGVHHAQPQDKTRLVMPLPVSIPLALLFYGLFYLVGAELLKAPLWVNPLMAGFVLGYLCYDMIHYATHHFPMRSRAARFLKRYHMMHHYKDPNTRFGVSVPIWDYVFGTVGEGR